MQHPVWAHLVHSGDGNPLSEGFLEILPLRRASVKAKAFHDLHSGIYHLGAHGRSCAEATGQGLLTSETGHVGGRVPDTRRALTPSEG